MRPTDSSGSGAVGPGLYGKVSSKGDFVTRRLPRAFVEPWDSWLQAAIAHGRERLADDWLPAYMNAPIWRFVLSAGVCGDRVMAGVMMPSIDRVGRHFPLALVAPLGAGVNPSAVFSASGEWFGRLEDLALSTLDDGFDFDRFDGLVEACGPPPHQANGGLDAPPPGSLNGERWRLAIDPACELGPTDPAVVHQILFGLMPRYSLWWCAGAERVAPSFLVCDRLPAVESFVALLDGQWRRWNWSGAQSGAASGMADVI